MSKKDLMGLTFGKLTVVSPQGKDKHNKQLWLCNCTCGETVICSTGALTSGNTTSCRCIKPQIYGNCVICGKQLEKRKVKTCSKKCALQLNKNNQKTRIPLTVAKERTENMGIVCKDGIFRNYILLEYVDSQTKMKVLCPEYGEFLIKPLKLWSSNQGHPTNRTNKSTKTMQSKYGTNLEILNEKRKSTCLRLYGVENPIQNKRIKQKMQNTFLERYGSASPLGNSSIRMKIAETIDKLKKEGNWSKKYGGNEKLVKTEIEQLTGKVFDSNRTILNGKELDLYNEEYKLAIEYCGLYWHNECSPEPRLKGYHNWKRLECEKQGIRLITIFEDEWLTRQKQVLNFLKSILGVHTLKIYARKTKFKCITKQEASVFLDENHIQGSANLSTHFFGLHYNNELVSVMTFGKHHRNNKGELILDRFAVKDGVSIAGGASKLFTNACIVLPKMYIKSWSDNRWSQGNVYAKLGFTLQKELPPDYSYVHKQSRVSKQSQQKKKTKCPAELTEVEWATQRGLCRIWDCGKKVWILKNI